MSLTGHSTPTWKAWLLLAVGLWAFLVPSWALVPGQSDFGAKNRTWEIFAQSTISRLASPLASLALASGKVACGYENRVDPNCCGEQWDADLGLYYNRARYLNTDSGRFWNQDSYEGWSANPATLHKYDYAGASPIAYIDPAGHEPTLPGLATVGAAITTLGSMAVPVIQRAPQVMNTVLRGGAFVNQLAATLMARGQVIIAHSIELVDDLGQTIGRFRIDLLAQRATAANQQVNMMVEGKGVPWWLFGRPGWQSYLDQLTRQAQAFNQAVSTQGQAIHERVIVFSSRAPAGLEKAWVDIQMRIAPYYGRVFSSQQEFEKWLDSL